MYKFRQRNLLFSEIPKVDLFDFGTKLFNSQSQCTFKNRHIILGAIANSETFKVLLFCQNTESALQAMNTESLNGNKR